jgi:hypothetical protein
MPGNDRRQGAPVLVIERESPEVRARWRAPVGGSSARSATARAAGAAEAVAPLDTLAQLDHGAGGLCVQSPEQTLRKRARAKYLSQPLATALADLARSKRVAAEIAGDLKLAELHHRFERAYRNTIYCASQLVQKGEKLEGRYCSNRWCLVCARVKTGKAINRYSPVIASWGDRWLVTLTAPTVPAGELAGEMRRYLADVVAVARSMKRFHRLPLVAVRKLECTHNARRDDYHPHFHFVVRDEAAARLLLQLWLERRPDARAIAQDVRPATAGDVRELFKYFTKLVTRAAGNPRARGSVRMEQAEKLHVIFAAMRGLRVFQPTGFKLPKLDDEELPVGEEGHTTAPERTRGRMGDFPSVAHWEWSQPATDWFNLATGEALAEYSPSAAMRDLVAGLEAQRENTS